MDGIDRTRSSTLTYARLPPYCYGRDPKLHVIQQLSTYRLDFISVPVLQCATYVKAIPVGVQQYWVIVFPVCAVWYCTEVLVETLGNVDRVA